MLQKLPVNGCDWVEDASKFSAYFIKSYNEENDKGNFCEMECEYPEKLHDLHNDLSFLPKRMKIEKGAKLVANLRNKTEYVIHIRSLNQDLNYWLVLRKVHRVI